ELLGTKVVVVDTAPDATLLERGQRPHRAEQRRVRQLSRAEVRDSLARPEVAAERRQAERPAAVVVAQLLHDEPQALVKVGVLGATAALGQPTQPSCRVEAVVAVASPLVV